MLSGDLTGKALIPIIKEADGSYRCNFLGSEEVTSSQERLMELKKRIENVGYYHAILTREELSELKADISKYDTLLTQLMLERVREWVQIIEERLKHSKIKFFMMPGNDDTLKIDDIINNSDYVVNPEGKVIQIDEQCEMISTGYSNPTPWNTPRECSEQELAEKIDNMAKEVRDLQNAVFNFHCPPYGSGLDMAPKLDKELRPTVTIGEFLKVPVGSTAVLDAIKKYQPMVGLHGHIHESSGAIQIGRTMCFNPGSEYQSGILRAYIIDVDRGKIRQYLRVEA